MDCYVCAVSGNRATAVALCWSCSAGLCLEHVREAASERARGLLPHCGHDTWIAPSTNGHRASTRPRGLRLPSPKPSAPVAARKAAALPSW